MRFTLTAITTATCLHYSGIWDSAIWDSAIWDSAIWDSAVCRLCIRNVNCDPFKSAAGLLLFYVLATSNVKSGWVTACSSAHSYRLECAAPLGDQAATMTWYPSQSHLSWYWANQCPVVWPSSGAVLSNRLCTISLFILYDWICLLTGLDLMYLSQINRA